MSKNGKHLVCSAAKLRSHSAAIITPLAKGDYVFGSIYWFVSLCCSFVDNITRELMNKDKDKDKDLFIDPQEFVVGYS